ncbi:MAG TPA: hypothetical protein VFP68_24265, partial [Burkholderiaceae bacterium]|nr:hypothetical protein [Burkholderiaceae bacterium]
MLKAVVRGVVICWARVLSRASLLLSPITTTSRRRSTSRVLFYAAFWRVAPHSFNWVNDPMFRVGVSRSKRALALIAVNGVISAAHAQMTTPGEFSVSPGGAASYV